jgi:hypothetical protein
MLEPLTLPEYYAGPPVTFLRTSEYTLSGRKSMLGLGAGAPLVLAIAGETYT